MYRLVVCNLLFSILFSGIALSAQIDEAQKLLNRLGYNAGPVDGAYGAKTRKALERFYYDIGRSFDGNLDQNDLKNLHDEFSNLSGIKVGPFPTPQDVSTVENYVINGARIRPGSFAEKRQKFRNGIRTSYYVPEDWTDISSPLENIKVSKDWKFIKDYSQYLQRSQKLYKRRMLDNMDVYKCAEVVVEWYNYIRSKPYGSARCGNEVALEASLGNYRPLEIVIDGLFENGMQIINNHDQSYMYAYGQLIYNVAIPYVLHRSELKLKTKKSAVDNWLADRADNLEMINLDWGNNTIAPRCHTKKMTKHIVFVSDCNDTRHKVTMVKLIMGLATANQKLFDEGVEAFHYLSQFYDANGVFMGNAMRGGQALHYSQSWLQLMSMTAEILATAGYNLMDHVMPNGMTYSEIMSYQYDMLWSQDVSDVYPYAKLEVGQKGKAWIKIKGGEVTTSKALSLHYSQRWAKHAGTKLKYPERGMLLDQIFDTNAMFWVNK